MKKVVIIVLIVFAVIMIVILVARPGGGDDKEVKAPGFVKLLGQLTPHHDVAAKDMAGEDCWDSNGVLTAQAGAVCQMRLPKDANRLQICVAQGAPDVVRIKGDNYGPQDFDPTKIPCGTGGESFDLYDDNSQLAVQCHGPDQCVLQLR
jgi:hypothetical protein